jgi:predicted transcriptional regulator
MEKKTMSSPSLRLTPTNTRKLDQFAASTGKDASAIANEAIAFWHEFYAVTALEQLEKKKPQPAGPKLAKRQKA